MAKITEYPVTTEIANDDVLLVDGAGGTRGLSVSGFSEAVANNIVNSTAITGLVADIKADIQEKGDEVIDSIPSDYTELQGEVSDLKSDLNTIANVRYNYFNPSDALSGYYYSGDTGSAIEARTNSSFACIIFPVVAGKTYVLEQTNYAWFELDENNVILSRRGNSNPAYSLAITPDTTGVKKVAISWDVTAVSIANYMILDVGESFSTYIPYPYVAVFTEEALKSSGVIPERVYTVGAGGDFTKFSDALRALKDDTSKKTIYVNTGVYDIFDEMGGRTYIESIDTEAGWKNANNIVPPNTTIIGVGDVILRYNPTDEQIIDYAHGWLMSPLNIVDSCEIVNIAVEASNCRYAIHIESASGGYDQNTAKIKLKNVRAKRTVTTLMGDHQTVGCGIGYNARWSFIECVFESDGTLPVFSVHTNAPTTNSKAAISLVNCVIKSSHANANNYKLLNFISQYLPVAITNLVTVANCYVNGKISTEVSVTNRQSYDINVIGGASYGLQDSTAQTSGYTINNCGHTVL